MKTDRERWNEAKDRKFGCLNIQLEGGPLDGRLIHVCQAQCAYFHAESGAVYLLDLDSLDPPDRYEAPYAGPCGHPLMQNATMRIVQDEQLILDILASLTNLAEQEKAED